MRTRMKTPEEERAAAPTTAPQSQLQIASYQKPAPESSLKSEIGELLWCLEFPVGQELAQSGWKLFERLLRLYVDLRLLPHSRPEPSQSTILHRPE